MKKILVLLLMLPFVLTSCDKDDDKETSVDLNIVGTWERYKEYKGADGDWYEKVVFNADGTGSQLYEENFNGEYREGNCEFTYEINGKSMTLTITSEDGEAVSQEPYTDEVFFTFDDEVVLSHLSDEPEVYKRK